MCARLIKLIRLPWAHCAPAALLVLSTFECVCVYTRSWLIDSWIFIRQSDSLLSSLKDWDTDDFLNEPAGLRTPTYQPPVISIRADDDNRIFIANKKQVVGLRRRLGIFLWEQLLYCLGTQIGKCLSTSCWTLPVPCYCYWTVCSFMYMRNQSLAAAGGATFLETS